ncbi:WAT1-related protein At5g40230-like [Spinacia oleracea]|uniref:WAT1-related protein At5g40230-like n=1 Tax=Spinacia oleracea TaxID=3562 RepID=A0ABM3R5K1_SPIOL|nr:WAT1-related protein At5g40230-like [Spinacia oleracea]
MWEIKIFGIIVAMEVVFVGSNTITKAAMAQGMSNNVYITYTHAISLFILAPTTFLYHRKTPPPPIRCSTILRIFLLAIISYGCSMFFYAGIRNSSPTLASATSNLSLAFTFIIAIIFRMEILNLSSKSSIVKLIGTIVSISGAFVVIFYKGLPIIAFPSPNTPSLDVQLQTQPNWIVGGMFLSISCILVSFIYVTKTWIARDFPSEVLITLITFFFETILAAIVTVIAEKDSSVWTPNYGIELTAILFGAVTVSMLYIVDIWLCRVKGPVFVAMFKPLQMIIAVIMGVCFLGDVLHLGSVIGGMIIALGFYTLMKGKAEEEILKNDIIDNANRLTYNSIEESSHPLKIPMLHDQKHGCIIVFSSNSPNYLSFR